MFVDHVYRRVPVKLAALGAVALCSVALGAPAALALNPQPLPPKAVQANPPILIGGLLTCHEYGCL